MAEAFAFKVVTPEGVTFEDRITQATVPTKDGEITVLAHHVPLVTLLKAGEMTIEMADGRQQPMAVSHGILEIKNGTEAVILADKALKAEHIDLESARKARDRAKELLEEKHRLSDVEFARFQAQLETELAKVKVGEKYTG